MADIESPPEAPAAPPPQGGRVGRGTVPADCSAPTSASRVLAAGNASGPAEPVPRRSLDGVPPSRDAASTKLDHTFGYQSVDEVERERRIRRVFAAVAQRYDLMNDLMSMGIHRWWKRRLVKLAAPRAGQVIVDLAGGTGDVAALMAAGDRLVIVCDPSVPMMAAGRNRALPALAHVRWLAGTGEQLPLADASVDTLTIAFGIRNVTRIEAALQEALRVIKPGGRLLVLEFSTPNMLIRPFYNLFSFTVIPRLGAWIARAPEAYTYLVESIRRFPDQRAFEALIAAAGFGDVQWRNLSLGIAAIHVGTRPAR